MFRNFGINLFAAALVAMTGQAEELKGAGLTNWAGNVQYAAVREISPQLEADVPHIVKNTEGQMRAVGTKHSFSEIADTEGTILNLQHLRKITVDKEAMTVTFGAGVTYTKLLEALVKEQVALPNLPSLPHLNVVGSVVTGTHGGGLNN